MHGGSGVVLRTLARGLERFFPGEFQVDLLSIRAGREEAGDEGIFHSMHSLHSQVHRNWRRALQISSHAGELKNAIHRLNPDVILNVGTYPNLLVPWVAPDRPSVLTVHSNSTQLLEHSPFKAALVPLVRWRYGNRPVVVPSQGVADDLKQNFGVANVRVIPHGIDADRIVAMSNQAATDLPPAPYIVTLGTLVPAKDHATLLRAYAQARSKGLADDLTIIGGTIGGNELLDNLQQLARELHIADHVHFAGHRANPYPYLRAAKFFVLSSVFEGFGLALVEAMTLGLPCLSTDCPSGPAEILENGKHGLLVPPSNPTALADAMLRLSASQELQSTLSHQALCRSRDFSLQRMADRYRQLFLEVTSKESRSSL